MEHRKHNPKTSLFNWVLGENSEPNKMLWLTLLSSAKDGTQYHFRCTGEKSTHYIIRKDTLRCKGLIGNNWLRKAAQIQKQPLDGSINLEGGGKKSKPCTCRIGLPKVKFGGAGRPPGCNTCWGGPKSITWRGHTVTQSSFYLSPFQLGSKSTLQCNSYLVAV